MTHGGLFVDPVPGTPPVGLAAVDARLAFASITGTSFQLNSGGGITQSSSAMTFTVGQAVWTIPDPNNASASFTSATDSTNLTGTAGPSTGSRIDIIVVRQNNYAAGDANSQCVLSYVAGVASGSPSAPAVPAGAKLYATIAVPANASNAAACTVTYSAGSVLGGLPRFASSLALLQLTPGVFGQRAVVSGDSTEGNNGAYRYGGSSYGWLPEVTVQQAAVTGASIPSAGALGITGNVAIAANPFPRKVTITARAVLTSNAGSFVDIAIWRDGASIAPARVQPLGSATPSTEYRLPAGTATTHQLVASTSSGGAATVPNDSSFVGMTVTTTMI